MADASLAGGTQRARARCPRCGYDLAGAVATWRESCPLESICTECGLEIDWRFVLGAVRLPDWFIERPRSRRLDWVPRAFGTLARSLWPRRFWTSIQMHHPVRWGAVALYLAFLGAVSWVAMSASSLAYLTAPAARRWSMLMPRPRGRGPGWSDILLDTLVPMRNWSARDWERATLMPSLVVLVHLGCAAGFLALPVSRRQAKVRWSHVGRVAAYGAGPLAVLLWGVLAGLAIGSHLPGLGFFVLFPFAVAATYGLVPIEIVWWSTATGRYLWMRHAWGVGAAVAVMSGLAVGAACFWLLVSPR